MAVGGEDSGDGGKCRRWRRKVDGGWVVGSSYWRREEECVFDFSLFSQSRTEVRKREEKEAAEQRLNFLIQQTELYSHFIQNKSDLLSSEALPMVEEKSNVANEEVIIHLYYMLQQYFPIGD
ncbi:DNA-binding domain protein [Medicago truncatula]|uniref:DNA-binding domain protein n=1 Tax=Medicago truncatula TaxID=3880 RepID=G7IBJ0_MEDTR|nr:DNA-binding domain protein [Medicago truncatula]